MAESRERLFLALWPDEPVRTGLLEAQHRLRRLCGGRPLQADNLHITLHFLGGCTAQQRACVEALAAGVTGAPFSLTLDTLGHWVRPRIAWMGPREQPAELGVLMAQLAAGLPACGLEPEGRRYNPHVTLLRKAAPPRVALPEPTPLVWRAERFVLVRSRPAAEGTRYEVVAAWPLSAMGPSVE